MESTNNTLDAIREGRIQKLTDLIDKGINPYPYSYDRNISANELQKRYENLEAGQETFRYFLIRIIYPKISLQF